MKKLLSLILALAMVLSLAACGGKQETPSETSKPEENTEQPKETEKAEEVKWPTGAVTIYVNGKTGSNMDSKARILAEYLEPELGKSVVIENVTGNGGAVVLTQFLAQQPNSNSLCYVAPDSLNVVPLFQEVEYSDEDYTIVSCTDEVEIGLFANADSGITSLAELKAAFETSGETCIFSVSGASNINYMMSKGILNTMGLNSDFITDGGYAEAMVNVVSGNADVCVAAMNQAKSYIEDGSLVPLCVFSQNAYTKYEDIGIASVPSAGEQGYDFHWSNLAILLMRGGTDDVVVSKLESALEAVYANAEYQKAMSDVGFVLVDDHSSASIQATVDQRTIDVLAYAEIAGAEVLG